MNAREQLLSEATRITTNDREAEYGSPVENFDRAAKLITLYIKEVRAVHESKHPEQVWELQPHDVAVIQILLKISRLIWNPEKYDNWLDIAGYAACGWESVVDEEGLNNVTKTKFEVIRVETDDGSFRLIGHTQALSFNRSNFTWPVSPSNLHQFLSSYAFKNDTLIQCIVEWFKKG